VPDGDDAGDGVQKAVLDVIQRAQDFVRTAGLDVRSAEALEEVEGEARRISDELFQAIMTPVLQRVLESPAVLDAARELVQALPRKMRCDGGETVSVRTARGTVVEVETAYYRERSPKGNQRRPGLYAALAVLGIWDRCTPTLASTVSKSVAMLSSLAEAQTHLADEGIDLDVKTIRSVSYRYAARARTVQQTFNYNWGETVAGQRVVVSFDGGRLRVRRNKRGKRTRKGRRRFRTDWHEPKLLIIYVVGPDGRPSRSWAPVIDGTLRGPDAVFALALSYAKQLALSSADKILFIADGAPWIWTRIEHLIATLGLLQAQVLMLIDFYHAAKQLSDALKLRRWSAKRRTRWLNTYRRYVRRGNVQPVIEALKLLCVGRNAGALATHLRYFEKNRERFAYTKIARLKLPMGSGAMESAIRRVVNLRIKGASIYWLEESAEAILLLRSFYKSNRWSLLHRMATSLEGLTQ
jgi:hypothetical protein